MAKLHSIPGASDAPMSATGWLANNWTSPSCSERPPVIINPVAPVEHVLAWCYGEVRNLESIVRLICESGEPDGQLDRRDLYAAFYHRLEPLASVMEHAITRLTAWRTQGNAS